MTDNDYYNARDEATGAPISDQETFYAMITHLSVLTGHISGIGFILGPIVVWLMKRDRYPALDRHFREAINFQASLFIYSLVIGVFVFLTFGLGVVVAIPILILFWVLDIALPIRAALKARDGGFYRYPLTIRIF